MVIKSTLYVEKDAQECNWICYVYTGQVAAVAFLRCCHFMVCNDNINMSHAAVCRIFWNHFGELLNSFIVLLACFLSLSLVSILSLNVQHIMNLFSSVPFYISVLCVRACVCSDNFANKLQAVLIQFAAVQLDSCVTDSVIHQFFLFT